jgi:hypothetical protein
MIFWLVLKPEISYRSYDILNDFDFDLYVGDSILQTVNKVGVPHINW